MPPKIIKLGKKDDLASVIKQIKNLRDREIIFELEKGSPLLESSESMKLMKKTGEVLGKTVRIQTSDETGRLLAKKAGVLDGEPALSKTKKTSRVARSDVKPRFSDIMVSRKAAVKTDPVPVAKETPRAILPKIIPSADTVPLEEGSRLEFELERSSSKFSKIFILGLVVLVFAVFGLAVLLPKADVTIFARSEPITRDFEVTVDRSATSVDSGGMLVPGVPVSKEVSQTKSFDTTGTRASGEKATGTVTIYNMTPNTLTLRASTTTLVADGKRFTFLRDQTGIRGNGTPNTGIEIVAQQGGAEYNLPSNTRFEIVNAALGNQNVYAVNPIAFSGGTAGSVTKVLSQQDIDNATNTLIQDVISQAEADLTATNSTQMKLPASGAKYEVLAKTANREIGDEVENFSMTLIARVTGLAFKEVDVTQVVVSKINEVLSNDKYLLDGEPQQYTSEFKSIDSAYSKGTLSVHFQTVAAYKVEEDNLSKILAGKNESEIKEILLSKPEVDDVNVKFWPQWFVHKAPRFNGKININTILNQN